LLDAIRGRAGCDRRMTEDLQSGQRIEGVEIVNPFSWPVETALRYSGGTARSR
jgi:predicted nucleic acid-binding protein